MVVNCTAKMDLKFQKREVVVAAAEKYLGLQGFTAEQLLGVLSGSGLSSQAVGRVIQQQQQIFFTLPKLYRTISQII